MKATMTSLFFGDKWPSEETDVEVIFREGGIVLSYENGAKPPIIWRGPEVAPGHFQVKSEEVEGVGMLHRWPLDSDTFAGRWIERSEPKGQKSAGLWTIDLEE